MAEPRGDGREAEGSDSEVLAGIGLGPTWDNVPDGTDQDLTAGIVVQRSTIGRFIVIERVGQGGMGVVYGAFDPDLERRVALKILRKLEDDQGDPTRRQTRLLREAKAMAQVSHPNVANIYDVGIHNGHVFLAMEYLSGGTLKNWLAVRPRSLREILKMFVEVGRGLAGAHAENLIHRDFKPENVLISKNQAPKVVDFGLAHIGATPDLSSSDSNGQRPSAPAASSLSLQITALTRPGALVGTPAYMAPEQFLDRPVGPGADQFSFCVALYEAVYGQRPFGGDTLGTLADAVVHGRVQEPPKDSVVPGWIRKVLLRGLSVDPAERYASLDKLLDALKSNPAVRLRRRLGLAVVLLAGLATAVILRHRFERQQQRFEEEIAGHIATAEQAWSRLAGRKEQVEHLRQTALSDFDSQAKSEAEHFWSELRAALTQIDADLDIAETSLHAALDLDRNRADARTRLGAVLLFRAETADARFDEQRAVHYLDQLRAVDPGNAGLRRWSEAVPIRVTTDPPGVAVAVESVVSDAEGRRRYDASGGTKIAPCTLSLRPGSHRLVLTASGRATVKYPLLVGHDGPGDISIRLPPDRTVPSNFVYVPDGDFYFGDADESLRRTFLNAPPIHRLPGRAFLIAKYETTYRDWLQFLSEQPRRAQRRLGPALLSDRGSVSLSRKGRGPWRLKLVVAGFTAEADAGQLLSLPRRQKRIAQHWEDFPVTGISYDDASEYIAWLRQTDRVPGARFCRETEWVRAARGADDRVYPSGDELLPDDADIDVTYARTPGAFGPDEVGSHTASDSPFGLSDMAGNAMEIVEAIGKDEPILIVGGGYYHDSKTARLTNREPADRTLRFHTVGLRVCADAGGL